MTSNEKVAINTYQNTNIGTYYAPFIFGDYWEPPSGSPICPTYIYFKNEGPDGGVPKYIHLGNSSSVVIQGYKDNAWENILTANKAYKSYELNIPENIYSEFRAIVSAPSCNSTNFYVNNAESAVVPKKTYDPYIICIGNSENDFTKTGVEVSKTIIDTWVENLNQEQTDIEYYIISLAVKLTGFYKSANVISYIGYEVSVSG